MKQRSFFCRRQRFAAGLLVALACLGLASCGRNHDDARSQEFRWAARDGNLEKVKAMMQKDPGLVFSQNQDGRTPLRWATEYDRKDVVEFLLANKADINARDINGTSPLHCAVEYGLTNMVKLLLAQKADVNAKDNNGRTPLYWAANNGREDLAELLLASGANIDAKDKRGRTPLRVASARGSKDVVALLRQNGAHK